MNIDLGESVRAIYFASGDNCDWMAGVNELPNGCVNVCYRFRYYDPADPGNDAWSGKDKRSWFGAEGKPGKPTLKTALKTMQRLMDALQERGFTPRGGIACKLLRGNMTHKQFMREFQALPFVSVRTLKQGDPELDAYLQGRKP